MTRTYHDEIEARRKRGQWLQRLKIGLLLAVAVGFGAWQILGG